MKMRNFSDFLKDLFTLRTVWIDRGGGRWAVRKRFHPVLKVLCGLVALVVCAGAYSFVSNGKKSEAVAGQNLNVAEVSARLPEPQDIEPEFSPVEPVVIPLPKVANTKTKTEIILPSEKDPNVDRIIKTPTKNQTQTAKRDKYNVFINKGEYTLTLFKGSEPVKTYPIAVGKNTGDKQRVGDNRTPTGDFKIVSIENASGWTHDFGDGKGKIRGAYGPWFLRLDAGGWKGIGIHGTHDPDSLGTNASEGCIRLRNEDIAELRQYAYKNMPVVIREN